MLDPTHALDSSIPESVLVSCVFTVSKKMFLNRQGMQNSFPLMCVTCVYNDFYSNLTN